MILTNFNQQTMENTKIRLKNLAWLGRSLVCWLKCTISPEKSMKTFCQSFMAEKGSPKRDISYISNPLYHQEWDLKIYTSTQVPDGQEYECSQTIVARASTLCGWKKLCIPEPAWYNLMPKTISVSRWHWSLTNQYFGQKVGLIPSVAPSIFRMFSPSNMRTMRNGWTT